MSFARLPSTLRNIAATWSRAAFCAAVVIGTSASCSGDKVAEDDEKDACRPGETACAGEAGTDGSGGSGGSGGTGGSSAAGGSESGGSGESGGTGGSSAAGGSESGGSGGSTGGAGGSDTGGSGGASASGGSSGSSGGAGGTGGSSASGGTGGASGSAGSGGACATDGFFLCECLPSFGGVVQTLDSAGDEFAAVPAMTFQVREMPYLSPSFQATIAQEVSVRAAWSEEAFVAHVHVTDPLILPDTVSATLWNGDNVQFFVAGTANLTGSYSGIEDGGATHVIITPPAESTAARAITIYEPCYGCAMVTALPTTSYAARAVSDGYEIEVRLPWSAYAEPRVSGTRFALNLTIGVANTAGYGLELEGVLKNDPTLSSASCSPTPTTHPGCDDRVWCTPRLE